MQVRERARASGADALDGLGPFDTKLTEQQTGDQSAAVHPMGTHHVDALRRLRVFAARGPRRFGNHPVNPEPGGKRAIVICEDAGHPEAGGRAVCWRHVAGTVHQPGGSEEGFRHVIADVAARAAHPDFGVRVAGLAGSQHKARPREIVAGAKLDGGVFEHLMSW